MPTGAVPAILLIEDDAAVARTVIEGLSGRGFSVRHAWDLAAGRAQLVGGPPDAVVLDLTLPDGDGAQWAAQLRAAGNDVPILMLTARDAVIERVTGFRSGADDYLTKPFDLEELAVRLTAILRRTRSGARHVLRFADVELDLLSHTARRSEVTTVLSAREAELLAFLIRHPNEMLSRERILQAVWGDEAEDDSNVLNVYVNYLRNKLERGDRPRVIHTVRGVGYMLSQQEPEERTHAAGGR